MTGQADAEREVQADVGKPVMFSGHYHQWLWATPYGITDWAGRTRICLANSRAFVVVGALYDGRFAAFDTQTLELVPFNLQVTPGRTGTI